MVDHENLTKRIEIYAKMTFGCDFKNLLDSEKYIALSKALMESVLPLWEESREKSSKNRRAFYFSSEYLMGRFLDNNLIGMGAKEKVVEILKSEDINYSDIEESEEDPALGNGGLGRLAAGFLDSAATLGYPLEIGRAHV